MLDQDFWNQRYLNNETGWDLGEVSPPIKKYFEQVSNKTSRILIPGAGNAHEAQYLVSSGFSNITIIDIAPALIEKLSKQFIKDSVVKLVLGDFFEHQGEYDIIVEQTFFCAIEPILRANYVTHMKELLSENGILIGLLFNREFDGGPPFGGCQKEYVELFKPHFNIEIFEPCYNSAEPRKHTELFIKMRK
jgi:SAM-dependent methyltransferase